MAYASINDDLCRRAGLEKNYYYECRAKLTCFDKEIGGRAFTEAYGGPVILLNDGMSESGAALVYLHEVAHVIAAEAELSDPDDPQYHDKYFGLLVAIMYRRIGKFKSLRIYEFGDTEGNHGPNGDWEALPPDEALIERFKYIIRRSAILAKSALSIEQIARMLHDKEVLPAITRKFEKQKLPVVDRVLRACVGITAIGAGMIWSFITFAK